MQETRIWSLGWEDPLEKEMAIHSSILAWKNPWTEEPDRLYSPRGHKELDTTEWLHFQFSLSLSGTIESKIIMCSEMIVILLYKKDPATSCTFILLPLKMYIFYYYGYIEIFFF